MKGVLQYCHVIYLSHGDTYNMQAFLTANSYNSTKPSPIGPHIGVVTSLWPLWHHTTPRHCDVILAFNKQTCRDCLSFIFLRSISVLTNTQWIGNYFLFYTIGQGAIQHLRRCSLPAPLLSSRKSVAYFHRISSIVYVCVTSLWQTNQQ